MPRLATFAVLAWLLYLPSPLVFSQWLSDSQGIMGTNIHVELWSDDEEQGKAAIAAVMAEMERINQLMSPYIASSELSILNAQAAHQPVSVSTELYDLIALSIELSKETGGAFDITFASVGYLYDYRAKQKPCDEQVASLLSAINFQHLILDANTHSVFYAHPKVKIDLGGIAKGHAVDHAIAILQARRIKHALVTAGGDTRLLGDRLGKPWMVGIRDPRHAEKQAVVLPLVDTAISTSGDYERYFEQDGERYHHILSPKSGKSIHAIQSVSIIGPRSTLNDALSTAIFVLGVQAGIDLLNRTPGYDGIIMDSQRRLHYSQGLAP
jgi:FAD:protein FMN transferase